MVDREINNSFNVFESLTKKPQDYLRCQENITDTVKGLVKNLYDITKLCEKKYAGSTALPELIVKSFDEEQIWQELELQNNDCNNTFISDILKFTVNKESLSFPIIINNLDSRDTANSKINERLKETDTREFDDDNDVDDDDDKGSESQYSFSLNLKQEAIEDLDQKSNKLKVKSQENQKISEVDDRFFKLSEMERFLETEEQRDQKVSSKRNFQDSDSDVDYFADELQDQSYGSKKQKTGANYKYEDFFAAPEDLCKDEAKHARLEVYDAKSQTGDHMNINGNNKTDDLENIDTKETKSSFEERQERLQSKIKRLEEEALQEKPWQLSGEVDGLARPQNSLLEEFVDFEITTRPAPVITEETTLRLEDIIVRRIKDKSWDDVERKIKPVETTELFKKPFVLDQERSKLSLAEVYEQEYLKQRGLVVKTEDEYNEKKDIEPQLHTEVRSMMSSLFNKLDALSSFHYTPRPVVPELKIISNIPAINMEEVAPVAVSNSVLLAPEEIQGNSLKKLINKEEQTVTDKKRALRSKKRKQRKIKREVTKKNVTIVEKETDILSYKSKKQKLENKVNSSLYSTSHSSKKFFSSLQEINSSTERKVKSPDQSTKLKISATHFKL